MLRQTSSGALLLERHLNCIQHPRKLGEHPIMPGALDDIEPAVGKGFGEMVGGLRRYDSIVAALPHDRAHVDLATSQVPWSAEQAQVLERALDARPQPFVDRGPKIGAHVSGRENGPLWKRDPPHPSSTRQARRRAD